MMFEEGVPPEPEPQPSAPPPIAPPPPLAVAELEAAHAARPPPVIMPNALQQVKLRSAGTVRDSSAPQLSGFAESAEQVRDYQDTVLDINIETWYPLITEHTFATEFVAMTPADGQLFVDSYLAYENHLKRQITEELAPTEFVMPVEMAEHVSAVAELLQAAVERVREAEGRPVFIKASSRSAKDAPTSNQRLGELFAEQLAACERPDDNAKLRCMLTAGLELLKAHSAADALALFLRSERIYQDMLLALERPERWAENFAVRRWVDIGKVTPLLRHFYT
jgi:hypothetical protein